MAKEISTEVKQVYPSQAWSLYNTLQVMRGSNDYDLDDNHSIITIFFDRDGMQEVGAFCCGGAGLATGPRQLVPQGATQPRKCGWSTRAERGHGSHL